MSKSLLRLLLVPALLAGCSTAPSTAIQQPLSARPPMPAQVPPSNGAIFQANRGLALFEDRRARNVGDTVTVKLVEKTEVKRKSETKEDRSATADISVPTPRVLGAKLPVGATTWSPDSSLNQHYKDDETNNNSVTGSITVTVIEVLPNGNLVVSGEKQVAVNNDTEYIRLAGVVNPRDITREGTVNSTQVADAKIESKNSQSIDPAQLTSMLARFFLTVLPY
ncbi:flagellar basal body L-ring protein FlgH [Parasulfuritortus cantonensis]|uniref:Flagellar L-ring protein n=1 Tax=Parasulfuritortus cantonensis TaxID=2528202 RepID=A0A4R1BEF8_9PROT|nr:flagellar basal body L-ring protein FlgH [Parasulfuritortus cantonensis]TCJ15535.1 flagellar basal body L-ring protein FlgH [Parasulfuritortus cantonensis]